MTKGILFIMVVGGIFMSSQVSAASFDCAKAGTPVEKTICADTTLSGLDQRLSIAYRQTLLAGRKQTALKKAQLAWLKSIRKVKAAK